MGPTVYGLASGGPRLPRVTVCLAFLVGLATPNALNAQSWSLQSGTSNIYYTSGNVGVSNSSPDAPLTVGGLAHVTGTTSPSFIGQGAYFNWNSGYQWVGWAGETDFINYSPSTGGFAFFNVPWNGSMQAPLMFIAGSGNVGIGTASPQHLLHVAGTIGAEEIIVSSTGADYVFAPDYKLKPLSEVADYIKENHHLPDIPSAEEMKRTGVSLGDVQTKLLAKVEELTLHLVEEHARNDQLEQQMRAVLAESSRLETEVKDLESASSLKPKDGD